MTNKTKEEMQNIYAQRKIKLSDYLQKENLGCCVFIDNEEHRDPALNYFSGHSSDAILLIFSDGYSILIPWDENLAKQNATFDKLIPFTRYKCKDIEATKAALNLGGSHKCSDKVELPTALTYPEYLRFVDSLNMYQCRCTEHGAHEYVKELRMIKDEYEIECTKEAARIGDLIIDKIEEGIKNNSIQTEMDVALLIERECRIHGCQRTGFDTLAAGPSRSFAIHAFPGYTSAKWPDDGLSILDFGVVYNGYTSDTTVTVAKGELSEEQEKQLELVQTAYDECLKLYTKDHTIVEAAKKADSVFAKAKMKMPHSLGHAIGLEIHEAPRVSTKTDNSLKFQPGMILTLEPGLYDAKNGGCRLENDILITEDGNQVISNSRIIRIK
ncbi:MAG: aminopeptidase P family protein [Treponema bryantii]|nr:aminopeptidase P family protein [Treponema bryantii]